MKKILFSDKYGLTRAVLERRKTQTRRICKEQCWAYSDIVNAENGVFHFEKPKYDIGEIVAIAQSYKDAGYSPDYLFYRSINRYDGYKRETACSQKGWTNKMFVASNLMPHQIHITNVRVEKLQDISDEDCLKEGIIKKWHAPACKNYFYVPGVEVKSVKDVHDTPQEAFAHLIYEVSRKDVWSLNPYVYAYGFELVK